MATFPKVGLTPEEYLEIERQSDIKHEYLNGRMWAMAGGTGAHSMISGNIGAALHVALRGTHCRPYTSDLRIAVSPSGLYTYADAIVVCGPPQFPQPDLITNPVIVFEVLSPSTASYDRGEKFRQYRAIPTLREYVLVSQDAYLIEKHERQTDNRWLLSESSGVDATLTLTSVPCTLALRDLYEWVEIT